MRGILPASLWLSLCSTLLDLSAATEVQGDSWCGSVMCVAAFVNQSTVTYQMRALVQMGWMAVGFGTEMHNSAMVIMWANADGSVTLSQRTATGFVEPTIDSHPPRIASLYTPLIAPGSAKASLAFSVPKNSDKKQNLIWALGVTDPSSSDPGTFLEQHLDSGTFVLNLTNQVDLEPLTSTGPAPTGFIPPQSATSATSPSPTPTRSSQQALPRDGLPLVTYEKLILVHASLASFGFLFLIPLGALVARYGRAFSHHGWFYWHWVIQVIFGIPAVITGWALGPLAIAAQGVGHVDRAHKIIGILLLPLYLTQLCLGSFIHLHKRPTGRRHPAQNYVHAGLGVVMVGLAFYQVRTGFSIEWSRSTERSINIQLISNIWIAWVIFVPTIYFIGFGLLPKQLELEREVPPYSPPPYVPPEPTSGPALRGLLEGPQDDGTHDIYSEATSDSATTGSPERTIEMREVERVTPVLVGNSR